MRDIWSSNDVLLLTADQAELCSLTLIKQDLDKAQEVGANMAATRLKTQFIYTPTRRLCTVGLLIKKTETKNTNISKQSFIADMTKVYQDHLH